MKLTLALAATITAIVAQDTATLDLLEEKPSLRNGCGSGILVVGGQEAPIGSYTWTVNLRNTAGGTSVCGGSLIAPQYVLTAAHCVVNGPPAYVAVGSHYNSGSADGERISVLSATYHPSYIGTKGFLKGFDIAILKLSRASRYAPIPLSKDVVAAGTSVKLLGWGQTSGPQGNQSPVLKENNFLAVSNTECQTKLGASPTYPGWTAQATHLCAGGTINQGSCFGDSGGPLVKATGTGFALVGDVSFGEACAKGYPDVYGRVSALKPFIDAYSVGHSWI